MNVNEYMLLRLQCLQCTPNDLASQTLVWRLLLGQLYLFEVKLVGNWRVSGSKNIDLIDGSSLCRLRRLTFNGQEWVFMKSGDCVYQMIWRLLTVFLWRFNA
jgi:hypothetical protein